MINPRRHLVLADLFGNPGRTLLVALSIAVGVFAVGLISTAYLIIGHDLPLDFRAANPHAAAVYAGDFGDDLVLAVRRVPGVARAEGRSTLNARVETAPGRYLSVQVTALAAQKDQQIDLLRPARPGASIPPLGDHETLLERTGASLLAPGLATITLLLPDGRTRVLRLAGLVYDATATPANFSNALSLYVNTTTMAWLGGTRDFSTLLITPISAITDQAGVKVVATAAADKVRRSGRQVYFTQIAPPGESPLGNILQTFLVVLGALGLLTLALSGFLVVNTTNALLAQQVRQIGVMKAIGGRTRQIVGLYVAMVLGFGALSLLLAAPLAALAGYGLAAFLAQFTNFNLLGFRVLPTSLVLEAVVALLLPLLAASWPIRQGTRMTVREAIGSYGLGTGRFGRGLLDRALQHVRFLSRPLSLSLRNTFRRKGRLALTLGTLTLAGAIFIAVLNLQASFFVVIDQVLGYFLSDVNITLTRAYPIAEVERSLTDAGGVARIEAWGQESAQILARDDTVGDQIILIAPPAGSHLILPVITSGRWLLPDDQNAIVIDNHLLKLRPDLKVGDEVVLKLGTDKYPWRIVGFYQMAGNVNQPLVYANREYLGQLLNQSGVATVYRVVTTAPDAASEERAAQAIRDRLQAGGIQVADVSTGAQLRVQQASSTNIIIYFLLLMALLIALVGGLGLMGTMSINVLERTREIGVMRAIGARNRSVLGLVFSEGMVIGVLSWGLGALVALPITLLMDNVVGAAFVQLPVPFILAPAGFVIWLVLMLTLAALASLLPARNAIRISVREALAYE